MRKLFISWRSGRDSNSSRKYGMTGKYKSVKSNILSTHQTLFFLPIAALKILTITTVILKILCLALEKNNYGLYVIIYLT